jgi:MFS family permease
MANPFVAPAGFERANRLWNRTFVGLLVAQFLAAFNDQAIHASAMFFAINKKTLTEQSAISLMPILFFAPWALFSTLAGYFADRYSKRFSLVIWKIAEVGITGLAFFGFLLGSEWNLPDLGVWIVLSTVFLMGTHSTFFVPAKYGAMPEILRDELLSKGNGLLESLSFLATILGTVCGGLLSMVFHDDEYIIGLILFILAVIGAAASLLIERMPAANPNRPFPRFLYLPLFQNLAFLWKSRPLRFVLVGIAFFTFMLAYMRAAVYMLGESQIPRWDELRTSLVVGATALGIGLGSPMAGWLSGKKVELGLIPIGGLGMVLMIVLAALMLHHLTVLVMCIIAIGFFTGFYLVPMFTQQQHRAPKEMKGDVIATCNFTNVVGAILASILFYVLVWAAHQFQVAPRLEQQDVFASAKLLMIVEDSHHRPQLVRLAIPNGGSDKVIEIGRQEYKRSQDQPVAPPAEDVWDDFLDWLGLEREPAEQGRGDPKQQTVQFALNRADHETNQQILLSQRVQVAWNHFVQENQAGRQPADIEVIVSRYVVSDVQSRQFRGDIPHYSIRLRRYGDRFPNPEPMPEIYDNRELPRYLFLGAGLMTLIVLLLLIRLLPDLLQRTNWLLHNVNKERIRVEGIAFLPGHGPVTLLTNAASPADIDDIRFAADRYVHVLPKNQWQNPMKDLLRRGQVVLYSVQNADSSTLSEVLTHLPHDAPIIPVRHEHKVIAFGKPLPPTTSLPDIFDALDRVKTLHSAKTS